MTKFQQYNYTLFVKHLGSELIKNTNATHDWHNLQQADITELMKIMFNASTMRTNDQQQPLSV